MADAESKIRVDKWLWHGRFFKTRSLAAKQVAGGQVRLNSDRISKPATPVRPGDVLTFLQSRTVRVIRVDALGTRRGPAEEARTLFTDLDPPEARDPAPVVPTVEGGGRPTKKARRRFDAERPSALD